MIVVSILDNSITHAHTYVIMVLCVPVATHGYLPSRVNKYLLNLLVSWSMARLSCIHSMSKRMGISLSSELTNFLAKFIKNIYFFIVNLFENINFDIIFL